MDIEEKIREIFASIADKYVRRILENLTEKEINKGTNIAFKYQLSLEGYLN